MPYTLIAAALFITFIMPNPAQSSYCATHSEECIKKCEEEKIKLEREINTHPGKSIDEKLKKEIFSKLHKVEVRLHECRKECSTDYSKCSSGTSHISIGRSHREIGT